MGGGETIMEEWRTRLLDERCELYKKIKGLKCRLANGNSSFDYTKEFEQLEIMKQYLAILDRRIEEWK